MKHINKHILEAIQRGVELALDDFEEEPSNAINPQRERIRNNNAIKKSIELEKIVVDLGLPSGTLWCKHNIGAKTQLEDGKYFAWGELKSKKDIIGIIINMQELNTICLQNTVMMENFLIHICSQTI